MMCFAKHFLAVMSPPVEANSENWLTSPASPTKTGKKPNTPNKHKLGQDLAHKAALTHPSKHGVPHAWIYLLNHT